MNYLLGKHSMSLPMW